MIIGIKGIKPQGRPRGSEFTS